MTDLKQRERTVIEAVDVAALKQRAGEGSSGRLRLRLDKVATRLLDRLRAGVSETVPDGTTVLLTITAPIRLASQTAAALEDRIQTLLARQSARRDETATIHGNRIRIRVVKSESERVPKFLGFVHNRDSDALLLLNMTRQWLALISARARKKATRIAAARWLVVTSTERASNLEAHRYIVSQLRPATDFKKILMAFGDGQVEVLDP
jgi:hypothetical protein